MKNIEKEKDRGEKKEKKRHKGMQSCLFVVSSSYIQSWAAHVSFIVWLYTTPKFLPFLSGVEQQVDELAC